MGDSTLTELQHLLLELFFEGSSSTSRSTRRPSAHRRSPRSDRPTHHASWQLASCSPCSTDRKLATWLALVSATDLSFAAIGRSGRRCHEVESLDMVGADDGEVRAVYGRQSCHLQSLGDGDEAGVGSTEW